jgi:hypothetical protein
LAILGIPAKLQPQRHPDIILFDGTNSCVLGVLHNGFACPVPQIWSQPTHESTGDTSCMAAAGFITILARKMKKVQSIAAGEKSEIV